METRKEDNTEILDRFTRKASLGKFRVLGYDQYDHNNKEQPLYKSTLDGV
jgi:hypothetical protein